MASPFTAAIQAAIVTDITEGSDRETTRTAVSNWLEKSKAETADSKLRVVLSADTALRDSDMSIEARSAIKSILEGLAGSK